MTNEHDYVIVGAGSADCVLAACLTEDPHTRVLVIEAGGRDSNPAVRIPAAFSRLFKTPCDWNYTTVPQRELAGRSLYWPRGKMLGGTSSIQRRASPRDRDRRHRGSPGRRQAPSGSSRVRRCREGAHADHACRRRVASANLELLFAPAPFIDHGLTRPTEHGLSLGVVLLQPRSSGSITLRSAAPLEAPLIDPAYLSYREGEDLRLLVEGTKVVCASCDHRHWSDTPGRR